MFFALGVVVLVRAVVGLRRACGGVFPCTVAGSAAKEEYFRNCDRSRRACAVANGRIRPSFDCDAYYKPR